VGRASDQLAGRHVGVTSPFVLSALYSYNCAWNQDSLFAKHNNTNKEDVDEEVASEDEGIELIKD
jgi:hypothetical protein